jgi:hypothetical protein
MHAGDIASVILKTLDFSLISEFSVGTGGEHLVITVPTDILTGFHARKAVEFRKQEITFSRSLPSHQFGTAPTIVRHSGRMQEMITLLVARQEASPARLSQKAIQWRKPGPRGRAVSGKRTWFERPIQWMRSLELSVTAAYG